MFYENPEGVSVHSGFPNAATDVSLQSIDLNTLLVPNSISTFMMRIDGDEWLTVGIGQGDLILIDRSLHARRNDLVIWWHEDTFAMSPRHTLPNGSQAWGVVTSVIHQFRHQDGRSR